MTKVLTSGLAHHDSAERHDAIEMLKADHKAVRKLFAQFAELVDDKNAADEKAAIVKQICIALDVHCRIEEEIFYPAVRAAIGDPGLMDKALVEQTGAKGLVAQLEAMHVGDDLYDAKVMVLAEQVDHHATEEEHEMFPAAKRAKVDTISLGAEMEALRSQLMTVQQHPGADGSARSRSRGADGRSSAGV